LTPTDSKLDELRRQGDPVADGCIAELFRTREIGSVNAVLDALSRNGGPIPDNPPPALREYLIQSAELPADYDAARFRRAQEAFVIDGPALGVALMYASLPSLYAGAMGGAQLLAMTGQLDNHYRRRAAETLRFILDCMEPGGFGPAGTGIRAIQKVRLIHATVRFFAKHGGRWAALPEWGVPLNQEELAGTLLAFSVVAIDNATLLGTSISPAEAEDFLASSPKRCPRT
jgi:ER-bound oxygenase mpaB/B'/Rubber oxygenase, catalytic domain